MRPCRLLFLLLPTWLQIRVAKLTGIWTRDWLLHPRC